MSKKTQSDVVAGPLIKDKDKNQNSGKSYSLRAIRRKEDGEKKAGDKEFFNSGGHADQKKSDKIVS